MNRLISRLGVRWRALTGTASAATAGLGLLVLACVLVAMAGPRASAQMQTRAAQQIIAQAPADSKVVVARASASQMTPSTGVPTVAEITGVGSELHSQMRGVPLARSSADLSSITSSFMWVNDHSPNLGHNRGAQIELVYQTGLSSHVRLVSGTLPSGVKPGDQASGPIFPIAVTVATAHQFGLFVGERVKVATYHVTVEVSGVLRPVQPENPFWALDPIQDDPYLIAPATGPDYWQGGAFVSASEVVPVEQLVGSLSVNLRWVLPLSLSNLTAGQAQAMAVTLPAALGQAGNDLIADPSGPIFSATLSSGFLTVLSNFADQADAVTSLLSLLFVSLFAICAAVLLLAVWLLSEQRSAEFATLQARGASRRQLALLALRGSLPGVLVGAVTGLAIAIAATPGNGSPLGWWLSGLTLLAVLAGLPLLTMRRHRAPAVAAKRRERLTRRAEARRLVIEAVLVLVAAGGLITLRDHGIASGGTAIDPYTSLAPVLVAIPVAVVLLRCYPLVARTLLRLAGRRSGVTVFVGLARAVRTAVTTALPVFAMVLALALVAFAGMVRGAIVRGDVTVSWQQTGADAIVSTPGSISPAAQRAIAGVAGVRVTAAASLTTGVFLDGNTPFGVLVVDPAQYAALLSDIPGSQAQAAALASSSANHHDGLVPVLATAGIPGEPRGPRAVLETGGQQVNARIIGQVTEVSALANLAGGPYLVVPRAALGAAAPAPSMDLLAGPGMSHSELAAVVKRLIPDASVSYRSSVLAGLENAPLQHGAYVAFALGSAEAALLSLLVLLLALVLGGRSRQLTLARMNTMGLSAGQGRRLVILEALPQILAALVGGVACAALLAPLTGPELDLSVFTGTGTGVPIRIAPGFLVGAALGLVALAMLTLTAQTAIASRNTAGALRIGE
jgi:putative ABC transport system permease protein